MEMKKKQVYLAPALTVVTFRTERGYAISAAILDADHHLFEYNSSDPNVTQYDNDDSWAGYSWN
jgi:hypothetical protein